MPSATPQDADQKFFTELTGSFSPNGGSAPLSVSVPPGCSLARVAAGIFDLTLPASYAAANIQVSAMVFGSHFKANVGDPAILVATSPQTLPVVRILTTVPGTGATFDFPFIAGQSVQFMVILKYFTVLTF